MLSHLKNHWSNIRLNGIVKRQDLTKISQNFLQTNSFDFALTLIGVNILRQRSWDQQYNSNSGNSYRGGNRGRGQQNYNRGRGQNSQGGQQYHQQAQNYSNPAPNS